MTTPDEEPTMPSARDTSTIIDIPSAAAAVLADARASTAGRAGHTLTPGAGAPLKQTLLALTEGSTLAEHESPGAATLHVLTGRVRLTAGEQELELDTGSYTAIPPVRHSVTSLADAVMLLSVAHP